VRRSLFGAAGPGAIVSPRRLSGVVVRPLNFTVRRLLSCPRKVPTTIPRNLASARLFASRPARSLRRFFDPRGNSTTHSCLTNWNMGGGALKYLLPRCTTVEMCSVRSRAYRVFGMNGALKPSNNRWRGP
jgi:hypothetical protein